ncbi:MAG: hydrolase, partial [Sinomicrobium sp.]|nr:hydrolase [Sinomicrobium sp.]
VDASHVDVDPERTSLTGTGGRIELGKNGGGNLRYNGGFIWRSPELELNDVGFLRQADELKQYANVYYQNLKPFGKFRRINIWLEQFTTYDFEGNFNRIQFDLGSYTQFKNNWWANVGFIYKPRILTNTILRGGPRFRFSDEFINYSFFGTDSRKKLRFHAGVVYSEGQERSFTFGSVEAGVNYQPLDALNISLIPQFSRNTNTLQYIEESDYNGTPRYLLGNMDQQTLSASIRFNYSINPNLSIQYYGQPFVFRATYSDFSRVSDTPTANDFRQRRLLYNPDQVSFSDDVYTIDEDSNGVMDYSFENPDFTFVQFRSNLVLRWEYIPGSEIFLVWSQGITGSGDPSEHLFRSLDRQILGKQPENIFLIKATYRFIL